MIRRIRGFLYVLSALAVIVVIFEVTRPYRADNILDSHVDEIIGRDDYYDDDALEAHPVYFVFPADDAPDGFAPPSGADSAEPAERADPDVQAGADTGRLILVTKDRSDYRHNEMILIIPSLEFWEPVRSGTSQANLSVGPGLFEASGMPGQADANVSIAAHRTRAMFLNLDRLGEGDIIILEYGSNAYTYVFYDREVVLPSDWSVISGQGFDVCTLVTCTPVGRGDRRLVVRFRLEGVESLHGNQVDTITRN